MELMRKSLALGCALTIAGCAQGSPVPVVPGTARSASLVGLHRHSGSNGPQIYVFQGQPDAAAPQVGLVKVGATLYGTSYNGGKHNLGAVYSITTGGQEAIVHSFAGGRDGVNPDAPLTNVNGTLYGTAYQQGKAHGTIFEITPSGKYKIVHNFGVSTNDCNEPDSAMIYVPSKESLYGTAYGGGADGEGCIFKLNLAGSKPKESVVYSFTGASNSSTQASAPVFFRDALYVTTPGGGANGNGAVLKITLSGDESVAYSFKNEPDGAHPQGGLVAVGEALYGTTPEGGMGACGGYAGCGVVFKLKASGKEKVLYRFTDVTTKIDATGPTSPLIAIGDTLYGVATGCSGENCDAGVVFSVTTSGSESIVYDFQATPDSAAGYPEDPYGSLLNLNGVLYGTTMESAKSGQGTVYAVPL